MRWIIALVFYSLMPLTKAWGDGIDLQIGTYSIHAAIANTSHSRERGLMQSDYLCGDCGMLFIFPKAEKYSFWMKDTTLPLSIAFIADDGCILNIAEMQANSTLTHRAQDKILYALEMNKGWFSARAIKPNDRVYGLHLAPKGQ